MKTIATTLLLFGCLFVHAQNFPSSSFVVPILNENGDPQTNIIDANGAKQGSWYFKDVEGRITFKQVFEENELISTSVKFDNSEQWSDLVGFTQNSLELDQLRTVLLNQLGTEIFDGENLITICKLFNGNLEINFFGNWSDPQNLEAIIVELISQYSFLNGSYVFVQ